MGIVVPFQTARTLSVEEDAGRRKEAEAFFPKMAGACLRLRGFISANVHRTEGLIAPFQRCSHPFRKSHRAVEEVRTNSQPVQQVCEDVEYIPLKQARNPMKFVGIAWVVGLPSGVILFLLTKRQVEKNRLKQLKARQKMRTSNEGEYERERYRPVPMEAETKI